MSGFITRDGQDYILSLLINALPPLDTYYIALINDVPPTRFVRGSELDEPAVQDYARAPMENIPGNWSAPSGQVYNLYPVEFGLAEGEWGTLSHFAICDSEEDGRALWAGDFEVPLTVSAGDQVIMHPGTLVIRGMSYRTRVSL